MGCILTVYSNCLNNFVSLFPGSIHFRNFFRRVLQVAVHGDNCLSGTMGKPGKDSVLMAKISGKGYTLDVAIYFSHFLDQGPGAIATAVIHKYYLVGYAQIEQLLGETLKKNNHIAFFITHRCNNRKYRLISFFFRHKTQIPFPQLIKLDDLCSNVQVIC